MASKRQRARLLEREEKTEKKAVKTAKKKKCK